MNLFQGWHESALPQQRKNVCPKIVEYWTYEKKYISPCGPWFLELMKGAEVTLIKLR